MNRLSIYIFVFVQLIFVSELLHAQNLNNLPQHTVNKRFIYDLVGDLKRPALSLNGYDCSDSCDDGDGLKQVIQKRYNSTIGNSVYDVFRSLRILSTDDDYVFNTTDKDVIGDNIARLQARAFIALVTYILEQNGNGVGFNGLPSHDDAATALRSAMLDYDSWTIEKDINDDAVKWAGHLSGMARAVDLYLA